jgi:hypothetical protein
VNVITERKDGEKQMTDELNQMLQGENQDSPAETQSEDTSSGSYSDTGADGTQGTEGSDEEAEWNKLSGNATDRFRKVYNERQRFIQENQKLRDLISQGGVAQDQSGGIKITPQVEQAVKQLDTVGIATKEYVQKQVQDILAQKTYYDELGKLESKLDGADGKPRFAREEYFDYVDRHPQYKNYLPEDVYEKMFTEELGNWKSDNRGTQGQTQRRSQALRPTRTASRETDLTVDEIEAKLKSLPEPQRSAWYQANQKKINDAVQKAGS